MLPWAFLAICAYWQMMPILSASMGAGLDLRKLMVYPVPHRQLFLVEVLLRFTSGAEMLLVLARHDGRTCRECGDRRLDEDPAAAGGRRDLHPVQRPAGVRERAACWSGCWRAARSAK